MGIVRRFTALSVVALSTGVFVAGLLAPPAALRAEPAQKRAAPKKKPAAAQSGLAVYAAMPLAERIAIQFDLAWTGDYNGLINGEFNERSLAAVKSFQKNNTFKDTGVLNPQERTLLAAAAKARQARVGWKMVDRSGDPGARRPAGKASAEGIKGRKRQPLELGAGTGAD